MTGGTETILQKYSQTHSFIRRIEPELREAIKLLIDCFVGGGKLLVCGNGGSCADASHIVGELVKAFKLPRPLADEENAALKAQGPDGESLCAKLQGGLSAIDLGAQTALITAMINDVGGDYIFAQQVMSYGRPGDVLLGISTSGNSKDILYAAAIARVKGMKLIGMTGKNGGKMKANFDVTLCADSSVTEDIQDMHSSIYHALCAGLECHFWGN